MTTIKEAAESVRQSLREMPRYEIEATIDEDVFEIQLLIAELDRRKRLEIKN